MRLAQGVLHLWYTSEHHTVEIGVAHKIFHQKSWSQTGCWQFTCTRAHDDSIM